MGGMDCIHLAGDSDQWWAHLNAVMNLRVPCMSGNFLVAERLVTSKEGLGSMQFISFMPDTADTVAFKSCGLPAGSIGVKSKAMACCR
jgi:hypothetical protein